LQFGCKTCVKAKGLICNLQNVTICFVSVANYVAISTRSAPCLTQTLPGRTWRRSSARGNCLRSMQTWEQTRSRGGALY
jgi:hypothetical protein